MRQVKNVLKADLVSRFEMMWEELKKRHPSTNIKPALAWHGTADDTIPKILKNGLLVPGTHPDVVHLNGILCNPHSPFNFIR